jgi:hypothetical protein
VLPQTVKHTGGAFLAPVAPAVPLGSTSNSGTSSKQQLPCRALRVQLWNFAEFETECTMHTLHMMHVCRSCVHHCLTQTTKHSHKLQHYICTCAAGVNLVAELTISAATPNYMHAYVSWRRVPDLKGINDTHATLHGFQLKEWDRAVGGDGVCIEPHGDRWYLCRLHCRHCAVTSTARPGQVITADTKMAVEPTTSRRS